MKTLILYATAEIIENAVYDNYLKMNPNSQNSPIELTQLIDKKSILSQFAKNSATLKFFLTEVEAKHDCSFNQRLKNRSQNIQKKRLIFKVQVVQDKDNKKDERVYKVVKILTASLPNSSTIELDENLIKTNTGVFAPLANFLSGKKPEYFCTKANCEKNFEIIGYKISMYALLMINKRLPTPVNRQLRKEDDKELRQLPKDVVNIIGKYVKAPPFKM